MQAGDLVFCHSKGIVGASIRWAQRNLQDEHYSKWNHVAVLDRLVDGQWKVVQAEAKGVTSDKDLDSVAPGGTYEIVEFPEAANRFAFLEFVRAQVGEKYGFLTIFSCALDMLLPNAVCLRKANTWICSGLVGAGLWFSGYEPSINLPDVYTAVPAEIAKLCVQK